MPQSSVATKSNPALQALIHDLKRQAQKHEAPLWRDIAVRLEKPTRRQAAVNLSRLERNLEKGETAVVAGKVLSAGILTKAVTVAALGFSEGARAKITAVGGSCLSIQDLLAKNPAGSKVRILR